MKVPATALLVAFAMALASSPLPARAAGQPPVHGRAAPRPCSAGLVALTFDDGPSPKATARLVRILTARHVPATFFMMGSHVRTDPADARLVARNGFAVGNHTWSHPVLTRLSDAAVRHELVSTTSEQRRKGIRPSGLMRPPYGVINSRVRRIVLRQKLVPVLWTIDSRDWAGGTARQIAARVLGALRKHQTNIVLQHDGVRRSPISVSAVPGIIDGARRRGFCFAALDRAGRPTPPVPVLRVSVAAGREAGRVPARLALTLSQPTSRPVSVRVSTVAGSARPRQDFVPVARTVVFPVGSTRATVLVPVINDSLFERTERFVVRFGAARGLRPSVSARSVAILSEDPPPKPATPPPPTASPRSAPRVTSPAPDARSEGDVVVADPAAGVAGVPPAP